MFKSRLNYTLGILVLVLTIQQSIAQAPRIVINPMGHSAKIHNLLFTPDGKKIISISEDKTIRLWNAENGEMDKKFESQIGDGPEGMLYASAISPNGKLLAVAGYKVNSEKDNYIIIIDVEKGVQVSTAIGHTDVILSLSFNGAGTYLASGGADNAVKIWKVDNEPILKMVTTIPTPSQVSCVSFNSKTQELAVSHESKDILVFNLATLDKGITKFQPRVLKKHKENIDKVSYSPDGAYMASSSLDNALILWHADGSVVKEFDRLTNPINAIAFSTDSKILVGLDITGKGMSWKVPEGAKFTDYEAHDNTVFSAAFSPSANGNYMVASAGGTNNEILLWNPINGLTIRRIKGKGSAIQDLGFGEGLDLFICKDITKNGKPQFKSSFDFASLTVNRNPSVYNPSAKDYNKDLVQTSENSIELSKGKLIQTDPNQDGRILDFQGMADGNVVVASDFSLKMFDKNGYLNKEFVGHYGAVRAVSISNDGKYMASGGEDQSIILWKLSETGYAPSIRKAYEGQGEDWDKFFSSLPMDSLTKEPSKAAWKTVIDFLKANGDKTYKGLEETLHSLGETVIPFATLFVTEDNEWVCWTPRGYFSCSSAGSQYFGWHVNRGIKQLADFYAAEQYFEILYRPKQMEKSIIQGKRVEDILRESGERIFDLSKTQRPSAAYFDVTATTRSTDLLHYDKGKFYTQAKTIPLTVEVFDGGGGIKEINIYQNDKLIITDNENLKTKGEDDKIVRTYAVEMA
ncbi:MAG: WD40 repeat domain-containing protein, partial [Chryseolinea sp.]